MGNAVDDLTITYEEDGVQLVKELDKVVLSKGSWTTILFRYQEWDKKTNSYGEDKFSIRRYQKRNDQYLAKSKFTISSKSQAKKIIEALNGWLSEE